VESAKEKQLMEWQDVDNVAALAANGNPKQRGCLLIILAIRGAPN